MQLRRRFAALNETSATTFLMLLLAGDVVFILLHIAAYAAKPIVDLPLLNIARDRGFPEMYQYIKFIWIILILLLYSVKESTYRYLAWIFVFTYFLFDDSLQIHERGGRLIAAQLSYVPLFGLRLQDYGEVIMWGMFGALAAALLLVTFLTGPQSYRRVTIDLLILTALLVFFGLFVDLAHTIARGNKAITFLAVLVEDGGEMVTVSLMLWYVFLLDVRTSNRNVFLLDCIRGVVPNRRQALHPTTTA